jgi:serine/threonine protein kinase
LFDALPEAFGSYRVIKALSDGRFGPSYRGRDDGTGVAVTIKVFEQDLTSDQADRLAAMLDRLREAPLEHAAIVPIVAAGTDGQRVWVAEPWVDATPLDVLMRRDAAQPEAAQPPADVLVRITQLAGALDFAAAVDLYHGALHPRDILVSGDVTMLSGVGVLQALGDAGLVVPMEGAYVSPHRARGMPPTASDDIFSLAAIAYELLYGTPLLDTSDLRSAVTSLPGVDRARLADVLDRALSPVPDVRPSTALELAALIQDSLVAPDPMPTPVRPAHPEISIRQSEPHPEVAIPRSEPLPAPVPDLPLRASESKHAAARSVDRTQDSEPQPGQHGYWFLTTATLAIGLLMGFAGGYVVGLRDATPVPQSAERAVARAERPQPPADDRPAPTAGRDFTESAVPPAASGTEGAVVPPSASSSGAARRDGAAPMTQPERLDPNEPGLLQVDSRPRGAQVFVDGRLVGITPLLLSDVRPGTHAVRIDLRGHRRWVASVDVGPGERQRVAASLER